MPENQCRAAVTIGLCALLAAASGPGGATAEPLVVPLPAAPGMTQTLAFEAPADDGTPRDTPALLTLP